MRVRRSAPVAAIALLLAMSLSACATSGSGGRTVLEGTTWRIAEMDGQRVRAPEDSDLTPHFRIVSAEGRVHGATGCNRFSGIYRADGTMLAFGQVDATRMACTDPQLQTQETRLMEILRVADRYVIQDRWLWIMAGGQHRLTAEIW